MLNDYIEARGKLLDEAQAFIDAGDLENATAKRKELRILGLGNYYRENKLNPGDSILLEKIINNGENKLYISHRKEENILFFQKVKNRLEIFSPELINDYHNQTDAYNHLIKIEHVASEKKRTDSPTKTDFYEIMINNIYLWVTGLW